MSEPDVIVYIRICGLCGESVDRDEITAFWIPSRRSGSIQFNAHVRCVESALHPSIRHHFDAEDARSYPRTPE